MKTTVGTFVILSLFALGLFAQDRDPFRREAPPEVEAALRERVAQFYSLYQEGKFRQTEQIVAEEHRDVYYSVSKKPIAGFEIKKIEFAPDLQSAEVVVACEMMVAVQAMGSRMPFPLHSRWENRDGEWYALMNVQENQVETPFGKMTFNSRPADVAAPPSGMRRSPAKTLSKMYRLEGDPVLKFPAQSAEPETRSIALSNVGSLRLSVHQEGEISGVEVTLDPPEVGPNERMTISFTYDPSVYEHRGKRSLNFTISPLNQVFKVDLEFE